MLKRKISFVNFTVIVCGLIIAAGTICLFIDAEESDHRGY